jgi:predicted Zn-dependent peptidase
MGHRLAPALLLFNEIYGGSPASKLFLNVREKRSLCYQCASTADLYKGVLFASSGMKVDHRAVTEEAMLGEFAAMARGEITQTEFDAARHSLDHSYRHVADNPAALCDFYAGRALAGNTDTVSDFRAALARTTREDVIEAASHIRHGATFFVRGTYAADEGEEE